MGRRKKLPSCIISIRENINIKREVERHAKMTGVTIKEAYKQLIRMGRI